MTTYKPKAMETPDFKVIVQIERHYTKIFEKHLHSIIDNVERILEEKPNEYTSLNEVEIQ